MVFCRPKSQTQKKINMRNTASSQFTMPSKNIFVTSIKRANDATESVISSQAISNQSVRVNSKDCLIPIHLLMTLMQSSLMNLNPFIPEITTLALHIRTLPEEILTHIFSYLLPIHHPQALRNLGAYGTAVRKPTLFPTLGIDPAFVVDAAMRGEEDIVLNILRADPSYLLKKALVKNSVDVEHEVTSLQAAIMANDVQLIERMKEHFERLMTIDSNGNRIDELTEMKRQIEEIYKASLEKYVNILLPNRLAELERQALQLQLLDTLNAAQTAQLDNILEKIKKITRTIIISKTALQSNDLEKFIDAHHQAQIDNRFDFKPYIKAIFAIDPNDQQLQDVLALIDAKTEEETKAAVAKGVSPIEIGFTDKNGKVYSKAEVQALPFDQLTLIQKLNRFREKLIAHMQQEIICNPNHILEGLDQYEYESKKRENLILRALFSNQAVNFSNRACLIIFSQLMGFAERCASEPVKQDIRQGAWYLIQKNEQRSRPICFNTVNADHNIVRNSLVDISVVNSAVVDGLGYKFAADPTAAGQCPSIRLPGLIFATYVDQKQQAFKSCYATCTNIHPNI